MLPRVIMYNAVSLDGRIDGFPADIGRYYSLAGRWREDAALVGSETIMKAEDEAPPEGKEAFEPWQPDPDDRRALIVIPDSRGRVRTWHYLRTLPYWRDAVALCTKITPLAYLDYLHERHVDYIVAGDQHVDFRVALEELNTRYGVKVVRVDSGGTLNGVLLRAGLVDEVALLIHPHLVGGMTPRSCFRAPDLTSAEGIIQLRLIELERLEDDLIFVLYEVIK